MRGNAPAVLTYFNQPQFAPFSLLHDDAPSVGVLLIHGFTGTPLEMRPIAMHLHALGANCHVIQLPGMATDIERLPEMTAERWRASVLDEWQRHHATYARTILIGYSMGGAAAIQMAARTAPDLLVLLAPFWRINDRRAAFLPVVKRIARDFKLLGSVDLTDPDQRRWVEAAMPGVDVNDPEVQRLMREESGIPIQVIDELRRFGIFARNDASRVQAPVVVMQGIQDEVVAPRFTRSMISQFSRLHGYHEFPGNHLITLDTLPSWSRVRELLDLDVAPAIS